jgi:hypothetical protein
VLARNVPHAARFGQGLDAQIDTKPHGRAIDPIKIVTVPFSGPKEKKA